MGHDLGRQSIVAWAGGAPESAAGGIPALGPLRVLLALTRSSIPSMFHCPAA